MRKLIAAMKLSVDGKITGRDGDADWVKGWSDDYGLTPEIDACLLGGGMYPDYEKYWSAMESDPSAPSEESGMKPTHGELEWVRFAAGVPHYVLSSTLTSANWPSQTRFLRGLDDVAALKQQPGKDIYLVGGGRTVASLIEAGLVDELRLIVYPLIAGEGQALFATAQLRRGLELQKVEQRPGGLLSLVYAVS